MPKWAKGQSGNPGGRPKTLTEVKALAQAHAPWVIDRLRELAAGDDGRVAVAACRELLDRGFGRPLVAVEVTTPDAATDPRSLLEGLMDRVSARRGEASVDPRPEPH